MPASRKKTAPRKEKKAAVPGRKKTAGKKAKASRKKTLKKKPSRKTASKPDYLAAIFNNTDVGLILLDRKYNVLAINRTMADKFSILLGKTPVTGGFFLDYIPENRHALFIDRHAIAFGGDETEYEACYTEDDVNSHHYRIRLKPVRNARGQVRSVAATINEITTEKANASEASQARELIELFVEHMPSAVAMLDHEMCYIAHSKRWLSDYNLPPGSIIGKSHYDVFPEIPENWKAIHRRCLAGATEKSDSDYFIREDGSITYNRWEVRPWRKSNGEIGGLIMFTEVLNKQKETEQKLERAYRELDFHINNTPLIVIEEDGQQRVSRWSRRAEETFGWTENEVLGRKLADFLVSETENRKIEYYMATAEESKDLLPPEILAVAKNGTTVFCRWYGSALKNQPGASGASLYFVADISRQKLLESELRLAEGKFRGLVENSPQGVYIINETQFVYVNPAFADMFGYTQEEMLTSVPIRDPIHPDDWELVGSTIAAGYRGEIESARYEIRAVRKNGEVFWAEVYGSITPYNNGLAVIGTMTDITERKEKEDRLQKTLHELSDYKVALDESCIVSMTDPSGKIIYANDNFCRISKYSREELIGKNHRIINSGLHSPEFFESLWSTIADGKPWRGEMRNRAKDGTFFWVDATIVPFLNPDGNVRQYIAIRHEITKRKTAESALRTSETNLQLVFDTTDTSYVLMNEKMEIITVNASGERWIMKHFSISDCIGRTLPSLFPEERRSNLQQMQEEVLRNGTNISYETSYPQADGTTAWFLVKLYPIYHDREEITGLMGSMTDITKMRTEEEERNRMTTELLMRNRDLEQFGYIVSHNLRSPVANISGLVRLINQVKPDDPAFPRLGDMLGKAAENMDSIIRDLNQILLMKRGITENREPVDPSAVIELIAQSIRAQLTSENAVINTDFSSIGTLYTIKSYLHSIFFNLISNSIKYRSPDRPPVIIITGIKENDAYIFTISDNGMGIDLNAHGNKIFGLYKRFHSHTEGKGMGLYMVKAQVEGLGGTIGVESVPGEGTRFKIHLPETRQAAQQ